MTKEITTPKHDWEKINFGEKLKSKGRLYDRLICKNCGAKARRFGEDLDIDTTSLRDVFMRDCLTNKSKETK